MKISPAPYISLLLIAALLAGLAPPRALAAEGPRPARPWWQNFDISEAAFDPATNAFKCPKPGAPVTPKKQQTKTQGKRGFCIRRPAGEKRSGLPPGFQFVHASFTNAPPPQTAYEPVVATRVTFRLDPSTLGTLDKAEVETNSEGIAEVTFTAGQQKAKGALVVTAGDSSKAFPLEVVGRFPAKAVLLVGLAALVIGVVVVVKGRDPITPVPPPKIP